jgi:CBS domain-containing protein
MLARDIMTRAVATIQPDTQIADAITRMLANHVSGLPVVDAAGRLVGVLSEGDLLRRSETQTGQKRSKWLEFLIGPAHLAQEYVHTHSRRVEDIMTRDVLTVTEDTPLEDVVNLMERKHIKRVPVMRGDALVGIISRADLVRAVGQALREAQGINPSDEAIRDQLCDHLAQQSWCGAQSITVTVTDGVVSLDGVIFNESVRPALRVAAQNIPGVKAVEDHLVAVEPVTGMAIGA